MRGEAVNKKVGDFFVDDSPKHCLAVSENIGMPVIKGVDPNE